VKERIFVANASPLIAFERLGALHLLRELVKTLYIPPAVRQEVFTFRNLPAWIIERPISQGLPRSILALRLGPGESEAIVLALELQAYRLLVDDLAARRAAQSLGIKIIGTGGLLVLARKKGLIEYVKPYLDALIEKDFRISRSLYRLLLQKAGELE